MLVYLAAGTEHGHVLNGMSKYGLRLMLLFLFSTFASFMSWSTCRNWLLFRGGRGLLPWRHYAQVVQ